MDIRTSEKLIDGTLNTSKYIFLSLNDFNPDGICVLDKISYHLAEVERLCFNNSSSNSNFGMVADSICETGIKIMMHLYGNESLIKK
jgi:hypothetical protein